MFQLKAAAGTNAIMADEDGGMYIRNIKEKWFIQKIKTKTQISYAVTAELINTFVFTSSVSIIMV